MSFSDPVNWWNWNRRLKNGYSDLGPVQVPPRPTLVILTDQTDGSQWAVTIDAGSGRISISNDPIVLLYQKNYGARVYDADNGPTIDGELQLVLVGGRIGLQSMPTDPSNPEVFDEPIYAISNAISDGIQANVVVETDDITLAHVGINV